PLVVVGDLADAEAGERRLIGSDGVDRSVLARRDERFPASRCEPAAMDEQDGLAHGMRTSVTCVTEVRSATKKGSSASASCSLSASTVHQISCPPERHEASVAR